MKSQKLYFRSKDHSFCMPLESHIQEAKSEELKKLTLVEAIPDNGTNDIIWCTQHGECLEKSLCKKSICSYYESTSGRGVCTHRGKLYLHGNEATFDI